MPEIITNLKVMDFLVKTEQSVIQISIGQLKMFYPKMFFFNIKLDYWLQNCRSTQEVAGRDRMSYTTW